MASRTTEDTIRRLGLIDDDELAATALVLGDHTLAFQVEAKVAMTITRVLEVVYEEEAGETVIRAIHEVEGAELAPGQDHQAELPYIAKGGQWAELRLELQSKATAEPAVLLFSERPDPA